MSKILGRTRWGGVWLGVLLLALATLGASGAGHKRILILDPFGRDVAPFSEVTARFRSTLVRESGETVDFYEVPLDLARFGGREDEGSLVEYLKSRIEGQPMDLVVTIGASSAQFVARHRQRLAPATPVVLAAGDPRLIPPSLSGTNAVLVTQRVNLPGMVEDILQLQPQTTNIVVVFGASELDKFWVNQCRREFQSFTNRVGFTWLNDLPLEQILERCASLPPHSFILHGLFVVDAAGVPCEKNEALRRLHETANAPLFAYFASEFGMGPIGGRLYQGPELGAQAARTAIRILRGNKPESIPPQIIESVTPVYDWRELQRWGIHESRLPPGSVIQYRQPTTWKLYRWYIVSAGLFCLLQTALIFALLANRAKIREREREVRQFYLASEQSPVSVVITDLEGKMVYVNHKFCELSGYSYAESIGQNPRILKSGESPPSTYQELWTRIASGRTWRGEFHNRKKNGELYWESAVISPLRDAAGRITHYVGVKEDITEAKRAATELQRLRLHLWHADRVAHTGAITASLAHELNQPLTAILSNAQAGLRFLDAGKLDLEETRAILMDIVHDDKRAGAVISGLRNMLRRRETRHERINLADTAEEVLGLFRGELVRQQVELGLRLGRDCFVMADKGQVQQVILNLVMNAVQAMQNQPANQRRLAVSLAPNGDGEARLSVCDAGTGIPEDEQGKLFEAFWTTKSQGLGIGLHISRSIIESHGGRLSFANNPDRGATFSFTLPLATKAGDSKPTTGAP